jgi:hypothetical protein
MSKKVWVTSFREGRYGGLLHRPIGEQLFQLRLHFRRGKIAVDRKHDVGREVVALVEGDQIFALDAVDGLVLFAPAVRIVTAENDVAELALRDAVRVVVAA